MIDKINEIIEQASYVAKLYNQGQVVAANIKIIKIIEDLIDLFSVVNIESQNLIKSLIANISDCQSAKDYFGIADYLSYELNYVLNICKKK